MTAPINIACPSCKSRASASEHSPRISFDPPRIINCSCGWITPPGTTDSDTAWAEHAATVLR